MSRLPGQQTVSTKQQRIATVAQQIKAPLTSLAHHMDLEWLIEAYRRTRKDGAVGIDGQTAQDYAANLEGNLGVLLDRAKNGDRYRAPPVKRVYIPKADGRQRPIGIPTFEDKVLQRAVVMVVEPVYEQEFHDCSYGFRPGRSPQDALDALREGVMAMGGGWVLEADIRSFFDTVDHGKLREIVRQRIRDGVILRLIGKWLKAGVMEEGRVYRPEAGTPQGGVISPVLGNIFLHEVVDRWWMEMVMPRLRGRAFLIRYADDFVMVFERETDAHRVMRALPERMAKYGLALHPDKTRLVKFNQPNVWDSDDDLRGNGPGSFDLLGFTHYWGRTRKGGWAMKGKTQGERLSRSLTRTSQWLRRHRHDPIKQQHKTLTSKLKGHYNYYGRRGNYAALWAYFSQIVRLWYKWLRRRGGKRRLTWERMGGILTSFPLPRPRVAHPSIA